MNVAYQLCFSNFFKNKIYLKLIKSCKKKKQLIEQLSPGGRLILPVGPEGHDQELIQVDKNTQGKVTKTKLMGVIYVPLTDKEKQYSK